MLSVVIPAYNEEKRVKACLSALSNQDYEGDFEVVFVDNNSTDKTVEKARAYKNKLNLRIIKEKRQGRGPARARGFDEAKGDIVFATDVDSIVPPNWLSAMSQHFDGPEVVGVTGPWYVDDVGGFTKWFLNNMQEIGTLPFRLIIGAHWLTGFNFGVRKSAYKKAGGFDTELNMHEDVELTLRLRKLGKIAYAKNVKVKTSGRRYKDGLLKGFWEYQKEGFKLFVLKDKNVHLSAKE